MSSSANSDDESFSEQISTKTENEYGTKLAINLCAPPMATNRTSFCIEALLAPRDDKLPPGQQTNVSPMSAPSPDTSLLSYQMFTENTNSSRSPSISPGSEDCRYLNSSNIGLGTNDTFSKHHNLGLIPRPGLLTMSAAINQQLNNHENIYTSYQPPGSAFQTLPRTTSPANKAHSSTTVSPGHIQQMQLEWLARAGMFYAGPRLQDLTGWFTTYIISVYFTLTVTSGLRVYI